MSNIQINTNAIKEYIEQILSNPKPLKENTIKQAEPEVNNGTNK